LKPKSWYWLAMSALTVALLIVMLTEYVVAIVLSSFHLKSIRCVSSSSCGASGRGSLTRIPACGSPPFEFAEATDWVFRRVGAAGRRFYDVRV
jgi:hypothetical protein